MDLSFKLYSSQILMKLASILKTAARLLKKSELYSFSFNFFVVFTLAIFIAIYPKV